MTYGKNRIQTEDYFWEFKKYEHYKMYFYEGSENLWGDVISTADKAIEEYSEKFEIYLDPKDKFNILVYNNIEDFKKSNIGLQSETQSIGGVARIYGKNVFVYYEGEREKFIRNIKSGILQIFLHQMLYGENWIDRIKNDAFITIPDWYVKGLTHYFTRPISETLPMIKDAIQSKRYKRTNDFTPLDNTVFGHAFWHYIAYQYGENLIPNILYLTKATRSVESGLESVLGAKFNVLKNQMITYYEKSFNIKTEENPPLSLQNQKQIKLKKRKIYQNIALSPNAKHLAYSENDLGKLKVIVYDIDKNKKTKVFKQGFRLERETSDDYPVFKWHPSSKMLTVIYNKEGQPMLHNYFVNGDKPTEKPLFEISQVKDFSYFDKGKKMVLSAVKNSQSDLFLYRITGNTQKHITNDKYDDLSLHIIEDKTLIFSSNRPTDSLQPKAFSPKEHYALYAYDLSNQPQMNKITFDDEVSFKNLKSFDRDRLTFTINTGGVNQKYIATTDSVITNIDTAVHYQFFINKTPLPSAYSNLQDYDFSTNQALASDLFYKKSRFNLLYYNKSDTISIPDLQPSQGVKTPENFSSKNNLITLPSQISVAEKKPIDYISTDAYVFLDQNMAKPTFNKDSSGVESLKQSVFTPKSRRYKLNFIASEITSSMDFNFANQIYQLYNGGPYTMPGMGVVLKINMTDLFENYLATGGLRYGISGSVTEFFVSLEDRSKRWDKKYSFQRQVSVTQAPISSLFNVQFKTVTQVLKARFSYPFNEVFSTHITPMIRVDRGTYLSTDPITAAEPSVTNYWGALKFTSIFDNSLDRGLNLYEGSKIKLFAEHYRIVTEAETDFSVVGIDARNGLKIHRKLIWFNRLSASSSFGSRKLVHYLGAVERWARFNGNSSFNFQTPIAQDAGYYFQTIVPPLRGFLQNARNGNNFALINSELRWPVVQYFAKNPIKSEFFNHFQIIGFSDIGTAWNGVSPFSEENAFNTQTITNGNIEVILKNQVHPIAASVGWGLRTKVFGYFVKFDRAWGIENGDFLNPINYLSIELDF